MQSRAALQRLSEQSFDVLVIGGGITGAGIARDAALRGLTVALIEKGDFASGTSSRSSRLIHGGVRYLEHGHMRLVFEASAERRLLLRLAPHLVQPLAFTWPVYAGQRVQRWKLRIGLTLYDALSLFRNVERHASLDRARVIESEPALARDGLRGGVRYYDAATNDSRLTLFNVIDATRTGAVAANHCVARALERRNDGFVVGLEDALSGSRFETLATVVVNAAGPWSDAVRALGGRAGGSSVRGSKGSHIAVPSERIGNTGALTLLHPRDGRVMFALPAGPHTILGTTDTFTDVSPDEVRASGKDVDYLLESANRFFPRANLQRDDVISAWAGIRPLMPSDGSSVSASREHDVSTTDGMVTVTGGKLTTYRVMAMEAVDAVESALGRGKSGTTTDERPLPAASVRAPDDGDEIARHLHSFYGSDAADVSRMCASGPSSELLEPGLPYRMGEMRWGVQRELACTIGDLLIRRTHVAFQTRDNGRAAARRVAAYLELPGSEVTRYDAEVARIFAIDPD